MGADLITGVIEINSDIQPDWVKAENHINNLSDLDILNIYSETMGLGEEYIQEDLDNPEFNSGNSPQEIRKRYMDSLETCKLGWENRLRTVSKIRLRNSFILLAAGISWGDNVPECDDIYLISACGASKAAGFYS